MVTHPVILRGYQAAPLDDSAPPCFVKRTDQNFLDAVLEGVRKRAEPVTLGAPGAEDRATGRLRLYQPVHRTFNLVLLELVCDRPGRPRVHPRQIESAGFALRRVKNVSDSTKDEAWQKREHENIGWIGFHADGDHRLDPEPERRRLRALKAPAGVSAALKRIRAELEPATESTTPLFVAPPDLCEAAGRTILYGIIPATSSEGRENRPPETVDPEVVETLLPEFLRAGTGNYRPNGNATTITLKDVDDATNAGLTSGTFSLFILGLRTLQGVFRIFETSQSPLRARLNEITVEFEDRSTLQLGDYLETAVSLLVERKNPNQSLKVPTRWPFPAAGQGSHLVLDATRVLEARFAQNPLNIHRFDDEEAIYRLHAFARVRHDDECPPELLWSAPSEPFKIVPWWEGGGPIHTISLPNISLENLKKLKPNVAFSMPPQLANLLNRNSPKSFLEGSAKKGDEIGLGWICSFSLPIITLCAFIVLNIFLSLFDLLFQWMFYIKICLPFPKKNSAPAP